MAVILAAAPVNPEDYGCLEKTFRAASAQRRNGAPASGPGRARGRSALPAARPPVAPRRQVAEDGHVAVPLDEQEEERDRQPHPRYQGIDGDGGEIEGEQGLDQPRGI